MERSSHAKTHLLFVIAALCAACACLPGCRGDKPEVKKVTPAEIKQSLEAGLHLNGSIQREMESEYLGTTTRTWLGSKVQFELINTTSYPIELGQDLVVLEANNAGDLFDGVYYARGRAMPRIRDQVFRSPPDEWRDYGLSTAEHLLSDGSSLRIMPRLIECSTRTLPIPDDLTFSSIPAGGTSKVKLHLKHGAWLKDEVLASLRIALPELSLATPAGDLRFRLIAYLTKPEDPKNPWTIARTELIPLEVEGLSKIVTTPEENLVNRVLAANWLSQLDPPAGGQVLKTIAASQKEGTLLARALVLLTRTAIPGLEEHAGALAQDDQVPKSIRMYALNYLGAVHHESSLDLLLKLGDPEKQKESELIRGAILGLGAMKNQRATDILLKWAQRRDSQWKEMIITALLLSPEGLSGLQVLAQKGDDTVIKELALSGKPEFYPLFTELLHSGNKKINMDDVRLGLRNSDQEKAIPVLMDLLAKEPDPVPERWDETNGSSADDLTAIGESLPVATVETLMSLARQGNLRALQVLARIPQNNGCDLFLAGVGKGGNTAQRLIYKGVTTKCAAQGLSVLLAGTENEDAEIQRLAIKGLGEINDSKAILQLIHLLDGAKAKEAAESLSRSGPGDHAEMLLQKLLAYKGQDSTIYYNLVACLIKYRWPDPKIALKVAECLEEELDRIEKTHDSYNQDYHLMRLLRHISGMSVDPNESFDFDKKKGKEWLAEWRGWYEKQAL